MLVSEPGSNGPLSIFRVVFPSRCIFQHVDLLRQLWVSASLAINQLLPVWMPADSDKNNKGSNADEDERLKVVLKRIVVMARELELNDARALDQEVQALAQQGEREGISADAIKRMLRDEVESCEYNGAPPDVSKIAFPLMNYLPSPLSGTLDALLIRQPALHQIWASAKAGDTGS